MSNSRPSSRQLQAFFAALQQAQRKAAIDPDYAQLAARRDAYLASLR